jgi:hypothetical protein
VNHFKQGYKTVDEAETAYGLGIAEYQEHTSSASSSAPSKNSITIIEQLHRLTSDQLEDIIQRAINILPNNKKNSIIKNNCTPEVINATIPNSSSSQLTEIGNSIFDVLAKRKGLTSITSNFIPLSLKAMQHLQNANKPNSLFKMAYILGQPTASLMPLDRMPWGLIQYQIDFFAAKHINEVSQCM